MFFFNIFTLDRNWPVPIQLYFITYSMDKGYFRKKISYDLGYTNLPQRRLNIIVRKRNGYQQSNVCLATVNIQLLIGNIYFQK